MTHVRTTIREQVRNLIAAAIPTADVYASRRYAKNLTSRPLIDVKCLNENVEREVMGSTRRHVVSLYVRVQRGVSETTMDALLDADEIAVNAAIMAYNWSALLDEMPELKQVNWSDSDEGGELVGSVIMRYDMEYRTSQYDFETAKG